MSSERPCFHCGEALPPGAPFFAALGPVNQPVCCLGCKAVAEYIHDNGLDAFYEHRGEPRAEYGLKATDSNWAIYDEQDVRRRYVRSVAGEAEALIEIGGMYCSACVWLLETTLNACPDVVDVSVNPATKRAVIRWRDEDLSFAGLLSEIARVGFKPQPRAPGTQQGTASDEQRSSLRRLIVAAAAGMQVMMFAVALYAGAHYGIEGRIEQFLRVISLIVCLPIMAYSARPFFAGAIRGLRARQPGMDLPVALAISAAFAASTWATFTGSGDIYFDSVAMFVLFLSATRYLEMRSRHRADDAAQALTNMLPETATRLAGEVAEVVAIERLDVEDIVLLRPGDVIPTDGELISGRCEVDESLITGESMPVLREAGMPLVAGSIVRVGNASYRVTLTGANTSLAETARMLERARNDRPVVAQLADRIASRFVIAVLVIATLTGIVWLRIAPDRAFEVVLATLVVTCPCALSLATPAALAAAASRLASEGFLMIRSRVLDVLTRQPTIILDKTGTLTEGRPAIEDVQVIDAARSADECLAIAAALESGSEHVLARAFSKISPSVTVDADSIEVVPGSGVQARIAGRRWRIGKAGFAVSAAEVAAPGDDAATYVYLACNEASVARFRLVDQLRPDAQDAIGALRSMGFPLVIASGDSAPAVRAVAGRLGIDDWYAGQGPEDKLALAEKMRGSGRPVLMVGDGINDAPVLAAADASIAIDAGTALARASADAVVPGRRLQTLVQAVHAASLTRRIIRQNILWAIGYNLAAVPLAVSGMLAPWLAALGMSLSSFVVVVNTMRLRSAHAPAASIGAATRDATALQARS